MRIGILAQQLGRTIGHHAPPVRHLVDGLRARNHDVVIATTQTRTHRSHVAGHLPLFALSLPHRHRSTPIVPAAQLQSLLVGRDLVHVNGIDAVSVRTLALAQRQSVPSVLSLSSAPPPRAPLALATVIAAPSTLADQIHADHPDAVVAVLQEQHHRHPLRPTRTAFRHALRVAPTATCLACAPSTDELGDLFKALRATDSATTLLTLLPSHALSEARKQAARHHITQRLHLVESSPAWRVDAAFAAADGWVRTTRSSYDTPAGLPRLDLSATTDHSADLQGFAQTVRRNNHKHHGTRDAHINQLLDVYALARRLHAER